MEAAFEKEWKKTDGRPGKCENVRLGSKYLTTQSLDYLTI